MERARPTAHQGVTSDWRMVCKDGLGGRAVRKGCSGQQVQRQPRHSFTLSPEFSSTPGGQTPSSSPFSFSGAYHGVCPTSTASSAITSAGRACLHGGCGPWRGPGGGCVLPLRRLLHLRWPRKGVPLTEEAGHPRGSPGPSFKPTHPKKPVSPLRGGAVSLGEARPLMATAPAEWDLKPRDAPLSPLTCSL